MTLPPILDRLIRFHDRVAERVTRVLVGRWFWPLLAAWVLLLYVLRLALFPAASQDDAEQLLYVQTLAGGYHPAQPPLYTWLFWAMAQVMGPGLSALMTVKFLLYFALFAFMALAAREMLPATDLEGRPRRARLAALSLLAVFYVGYEVVYNYSNTVTYMAAIALTLWALARLHSSGSVGSYALLGLAVGLGGLSKYGYLLFFATLLAALLGVRDFRRRLLRPAVLVAAAVAVVVAAPHLIWLITERQDLVAAFRGRLIVGDHLSWAEKVAAGLGKIVIGPLVFFAPLWLLAPIGFPQALWPGAPAGREALAWRQVFLRFVGLVFLVLVVGVLAFGIAHVRTHYFFILVGLPVYLILRAHAVGTRPVRFARWGLALAVLGVIWPLVMVGRAYVEPAYAKRTYMNMPYGALAVRLRQAGVRGGTLLVHFHRVQMAGNFADVMPGARVVSTKYPFFRLPQRRVAPGCLLLWNATLSATVPTPLRVLARRYGLRNLPARRQGIVRAEIAGSGGRMMAVAYLRIAPGPDAKICGG